MISLFDENFDYDDTSQKIWSDLSPFLRESKESRTLRGSVSLPIHPNRIAAVKKFIKTRVLSNDDRKLHEFFPAISGHADCGVVTENKEYLKLFYANSIYNLRTLGNLTAVELRSLTLSQGWDHNQLIDMLSEIAIGAFIDDKKWLANAQISSGLFPEVDPEESIDSNLMLKIEALLQTAAKFTVLTGHDKTPLGELLEGSNKLSAVVKVFSKIGTLTGADILTTEASIWTTAQTLERLFQQLTDRDIDILSSRLFADKAESLQIIGERHQITRERVRQLELAAKKRVRARFLADPLLRDLSQYLRSQIVMLRPLEELLDENSFLSDQVPSIGQSVWRVFDRLDDSFEINGSWCYAPNQESVEENIKRDFLSRQDKHGVIPISDATFITVGDSEQSDIFLDKWLEEQGFAIYHDYVLTNNSSLVNRAAAILSIEGRPLDIDEIVSRIPEARSRSGLRDRIRTDPRFVRADKETWALAEWDIAEYAPIRSLIERELETRGGSMKIEDLVSDLTAMFSVSAASVMVYASTPPFETRNGVVKKTGLQKRKYRRPQDSPRFFRRGSEWIYRLRINKESIRGVSVPMPIAFASILDIQHGDKGTLTSPLGPQAFSWASLSPQLGTIRRFLETKNILEGEYVFLIFGDDGSFDIEMAVDSGRNPLERALQLIGRQPTLIGKDALSEFAQALLIPETAHRSTIINAYKDKGDDKIYEYLLEVQHSLPESLGVSVQPNDEPEFLDVFELL